MMEQNLPELKMAQISDMNEIDADKCDENGQTELEKAILDNNPHLIRLLLKAGASWKFKLPESKDVPEPKRPTVEEVEGADPDEPNEDGLTEIQKAIENDNYRLTGLLLKTGSSVNLKKNGKSLLMTAAQSKSTSDIVEILLKFGANVNDTDSRGKSALMHALSNKEEVNMSVIKLLLNNGADLEQNYKGGETVLHHAINNCNSTQLIQMLVDYGANVNQTDEDGCLALFYAIDLDNPEIVKVLLDCGTNVNQVDKEGNSALNYATGPDNKISIQVIKLLLDYGANVNHSDSYEQPALHSVCMQTDIDPVPIIKLFVENGANVNQPDSLGKPCLTIAVTEGHTEVVKLLLDCAANVNQTDKEGKTALHHALLMEEDCESSEMVKLLLDYKCDINAVWDQDYPALMALQSQNVENLCLLVGRKAEVKNCLSDLDPECTNDLMNNVYEYKECMDVLLSAGVSINSHTKRECSDNATQLMHSAYFGRLGCMIYLLKKNADVAATGPKTLLDYAVHCEDTDEMENCGCSTLKLCFVASRDKTTSMSLLNDIANYITTFMDTIPVPRLYELCRTQVRHHLLQVSPPGNLFTYVPRLNMLNLPSTVVSYLLYDLSLDDFEDEISDEYQRLHGEDEQSS